MKANKGKVAKIKAFFKMLGPGLVTGASDDDPSGITTYSQAGAQFGLVTLWTALITFPLMTSIQEMCARIGWVTSSGLTTIIKKHYPTPILFLVILLTIPAILFNIAADLAGMGAVANLLFPRISGFIFTIFFALLMGFSLIYFPYKKIEAILKYLCLALLVYLLIPFLSPVNWSHVFYHSFIPTIHFNHAFMSMLVAILGTTISPYLFFWQATMEAEAVKQKGKHNLKSLHKDITAGMFFSNLIMYFILLTTGTVLYQANIHEINTVQDAAKALEPLAGELSYLLFSTGIIGTGLLAIPVLAGTIAYMLTTTFAWKQGLNKKLSQAKLFYCIITLALVIGLVINFFDFSVIKLLIYSAILYGLCAPLLILIVLHIANNKHIMGSHKNGKWSNLLGVITFSLMTIAACFLMFFSLK